MHNFCTITTASHLFKCFALADSLNTFGARLHVLVVDSYSESNLPTNVILYPLSCISDPMGKLLIKKYKRNDDKLRWAMKPVFLKQLLGTAEKVIYVDNDIYFFSDPVSLFDKLDTNQALLTPHFYASDPVKEQNWLEANFRVGLYNAGFFGASKDATALLDWWAKCCLYAIKKSFWRGLFDDQKYLDLLPVIFEKVGLLKHKGCNVAGWNYKNYAVTRHNKSFFLNGDPLVFIHFAELSMIEFSKPGNPLLDPYNQYTGALNVHKPGFVFRKNMLNAYHFKAYFYYLKWRLLRLVNG